MKVISGKLKGRTIKGYDIKGTRPTMDRVKESVFGIIQDYVLDSNILDLFSGTGNYGIEGISNGAKLVYFNDKNRECTKLIKNTLTSYNVLDHGIITTMDYKDALNYYKNKKITFDLIFLDPPYKNRIINEILSFIENNNLLNNNGLVICEVASKEDYISNNLLMYKEKKYGDKYIIIYKMVK